MYCILIFSRSNLASREKRPLKGKAGHLILRRQRVAVIGTSLSDKGGVPSCLVDERRLKNSSGPLANDNNYYYCSQYCSVILRKW